MSHRTVCREGWGFSKCPLSFAGRGGDLVNVHRAVWRDGNLVNVRSRRFDERVAIYKYPSYINKERVFTKS